MPLTQAQTIPSPPGQNFRSDVPCGFVPDPARSASPDLWPTAIEHFQPVPCGLFPEEIILLPHQVGIFTFSTLVAKWPCQNNVIFSCNGRGPSAMRFNHQYLSSTTCCRCVLCSSRISSWRLPVPLCESPCSGLTRGSIVLGPFRRSDALRDLFVIHQRCHCRNRSKLYQMFNFGERASKSSPVKQMSGCVKIPFLFGDWF